MPNRSWQVLLIGGNSAAGKSMLAPKPARHHDVPWIQVDDLRLALQWNTSADDHPQLHLFDDLVQVYREPPETVARWRVAMAQATARAIEIVIANHVSNAGPIILEGDDLVPAFATQRTYANLDVPSGAVRSIYLIEQDQKAIRANMSARGRRFSHRTEAHQQSMVRVSLLYGEWLQEEATRLGLPVVSPRPYETLQQRVLKCVEA